MKFILTFVLMFIGGFMAGWLVLKIYLLFSIFYLTCVAR